MEVTQDSKKKPMVLIRVVKDHDLVLEFSYAAERKKFLGKLENFLQVFDHTMPSSVVLRPFHDYPLVIDIYLNSNSCRVTRRTCRRCRSSGR